MQTEAGGHRRAGLPESGSVGRWLLPPIAQLGGHRGSKGHPVRSMVWPCLLLSGREGSQGLGSPPPLFVQPQVGGGAQHLKLVQGQVHKGPSTQSLHVSWLGSQHRVEVEQGGLLLTKEPIAAGSGEQGLAGLAPCRRRVWSEHSFCWALIHCPSWYPNWVGR
jgi:hypothetical protein